MKTGVHAGYELSINEQAKTALPHGQFLPWVERNAGYSEQYVRELMAVAELPSYEELKTRLGRDLVLLLGHRELAAAGRAALSLLLKSRVTRFLSSTNPDELKTVPGTDFAGAPAF